MTSLLKTNFLLSCIKWILTIIASDGATYRICAFVEVENEMSDEETRDVVDNVKKALQEKVSDESANPERFIVSSEEYIQLHIAYIHLAYITAKSKLSFYINLGYYGYICTNK